VEEEERSPERVSIFRLLIGNTCITCTTCCAEVLVEKVIVMGQIRVGNFEVSQDLNAEHLM